MRILFIHQNFPGQFPHLAPALAARGHDVRALHMRRDHPEAWQGVRLFCYQPTRGATPNVHPWVSDFETKVIPWEACFRACLQLKQQGFTPDVIIAHHGWGESLFVKDLWPDARLGRKAREFAIANYDLNSVCLPGQIQWVEGLGASGDGPVSARGTP